MIHLVFLSHVVTQSHHECRLTNEKMTEVIYETYDCVNYQPMNKPFTGKIIRISASFLIQENIISDVCGTSAEWLIKMTDGSFGLSAKKSVKYDFLGLPRVYQE
ncbi:hypothetical protein ACVWYG_002085 [Pedobacter sp. UYEF25]